MAPIPLHGITYVCVIDEQVSLSIYCLTHRVYNKVYRKNCYNDKICVMWYDKFVINKYSDSLKLEPVIHIHSISLL